MDILDGMQRSVAEEVQDKKNRRYHDRQRKLTQDRNREPTDGLKPIVKQRKNHRYEYNEDLGINIDLKRVKRRCDYGCED